jgi:hypothetical protein
MSLIACFIDNIDTVLICQFKVSLYRRIVRCPYTIDIESPEEIKILSDRLFVHRMSKCGMLHMAVNTVQFNRLAIKIKHLVTYLGFPETYLSCCSLFNISAAINQFKRKPVKIWKLT